MVTRYFGGVLLGAGGLVRAYSHGAKLAVDAAERMTMSECTELALEFGYDLYGKISYLLPQFHAQTTFSDFGAVVRLQVLVKDCFVPSFEKALAEGTSALVTPRAVDRPVCLHPRMNPVERWNILPFARNFCIRQEFFYLRSII